MMHATSFWLLIWTWQLYLQNLHYNLINTTKHNPFFLLFEKSTPRQNSMQSTIASTVEEFFFQLFCYNKYSVDKKTQTKLDF